MDKIKEAIASLKKPLEAALRDPSEIANLGEYESLVTRTLDGMAHGRALRFTVEMLIWDLRNELRGFERFDGPNKGVVIDNCYRILSRLEGLTDNEEEFFLKESEIAEEMKAQVARDLSSGRARRAQRTRREARPDRDARPEREQRPPAQARPAEPPAAPPAASDAGDEPAENGGDGDSASKGSSRRRRRSRRKRKAKPQSD